MEYNSVSDEAPEGMTALEIASAGQRFLAFLLDSVLSIMLGIMGFAISFGMGERGEFLSTLLGLMYWVVVLGMVAIRGQSPGKIALGIKIVNTNGSSIGFGRTLVREIVGKFVSAMIILLGFLWILFDGRRQGWHDKIASTIVVRLG